MLLYSIDGIRLNDSWYAKDGDTYHAFFLEYPENGDPEGYWCRQTVGHMVSKDLKAWEYRGTVLSPKKGHWNDKGIATGSIVKHVDLWYMLYTGNSESTVGGLAIATSRDLETWERRGTAPQIPTPVRYRIDHGGEPLDFVPIADPYIYPTPVGGQYYIFINGHGADLPINNRAVIAIFRTSDFVTFEPYKAALVDSCDRVETVCVWKHDGRFYMYGGAVTSFVDETGSRIVGQTNENVLYTSDSLDGPYQRHQALVFPAEEDFPDEQPYIAKVIEAPDGSEVMLANMIPQGAVGPYGMTYRKDGILNLYLK